MIKIPKRYGFNISYLGKEQLQNDLWVNPRHLVAVVNTWSSETHMNTTLVVTNGSYFSVMTLDLHKEFLGYIEEQLDAN